MTDGRVVLRVGHQAIRAHISNITGVSMHEAHAVGQFDAFRPLQRDEMVERGAIEAAQLHDDLGGMIAARHRKIGTAEVWASPEGER